MTQGNGRGGFREEEKEEEEEELKKDRERSAMRGGLFSGTVSLFYMSTSQPASQAGRKDGSELSGRPPLLLLLLRVMPPWKKPLRR